MEHICPHAETLNVFFLQLKSVSCLLIFKALQGDITGFD